MLILLFAAFQVVLIFLNSWLLANTGSIISILISILIYCQLLHRKCICLFIGKCVCILLNDYKRIQEIEAEFRELKLALLADPETLCWGVHK